MSGVEAWLAEPVSLLDPALSPHWWPVSQRLASALKARLDSKGWSRNTLAERTGINASTLWRWMVGQASPPIDKVLQIAGKVGCDAADLIPKKAR